PFTVFLKLRDIGQNVLPPYEEEYLEVPWDVEQQGRYKALESSLTAALRKALAVGDNSLLGVVMATLLAWPDTCFRPETVKHPRTRELLASVPALYGEDDPTPKERILNERCLEQKARGRRVLVYSIYSGKRDTCGRLKKLLTDAGLKAAVMYARVPTDQREDWVAAQVDKGIDVLICNPDLV